MISEKADKMTDLLVGASAAYGCSNSQKMHELLLEAVTQLHTYIAELEEAQRWIPVSEPPIITHYNDAVSAGKVSVDVKTSTDNNKRE